MRRYKKIELLETVDMLVEANEVIDRLCKSNTERTLEILGQCQESAILLGNLIESKGEGFAELVEVLESYCENIYQISTVLTDENQVKKLSKKIQKQLLYLNNRIRQEIPEDKKEVVFFPYKASMWDSLESVWMAADADEGTDAYVVPIPYYDKNPDGSFRELHYEGDEYPDYVPVTHYEEYDFEERCPDVIFIHNPYDQYNYVTSVHPRFYSGNLKKFTEKLVYIPYFILGEVKPDDDVAIEGMKHFCINEAVKNADKVIVQSEDMRQVYIKVLTEESGGSEEAKAYWENKIDGSGSPKVIKLSNTKKEDLKIPQKWLKIIEKPDGSWKKVVFYNISVTSLLNDEDKLLRKMESVFEIFKTNTDEVVLLWRPHPLIQSTIESMRPQLWKAYQEIRDRYIEEGWGIYDDTADVDRAIILSDAYYGVGSSSVVQLYMKTGKPVMIQDVDIADESTAKDSCNLVNETIMDAVIYEDRIWFNTGNFNGLFSMNIITKEVVHEGKFPNEEYGTKRLYESMRLINGKIYFIPFYARSIAVFDINKKEFNSILLEEKRIECGSDKPLFAGAEVCGKFIYVIPVLSKAIVRLNTENNEIEYITGWVEKAKNLIFNKNDAYFRKQALLVNNKLMVPFCNANAILELNCDTLECMVYRLGIEERGYSGICYDGCSYWLSPRASGALIQWNRQTKDIEVINIDEDKATRNPYAYVGVLCNKSEIVVFPTSSSEKKNIELVNTKITIPEGMYNFAKEEEGSWLYYQSDIGLLTMVNKNDNSKTEIEIRIKTENIDTELLIRESKSILYEKKYLNINNLIKAL